MNKVFLSGNLTRDPDVRYTQSGKAMARMGIAVNHGYGEKQTTYFFNMTAWNKTAEFCQRYLGKGSRVLVEGALQTYSYEGKDGTTKSGVDIVVENIEFAGGKRENNVGEEFGGRGDNYSNNSASRKRAETTSNGGFEDDFASEDIADEDVPF